MSAEASSDAKQKEINIETNMEEALRGPQRLQQVTIDMSPDWHKTRTPCATTREPCYERLATT